MSALLAQAQQMQQKLLEAQQQLANSEVHGQAGGAGGRIAPANAPSRSCAIFVTCWDASRIAPTIRSCKVSMSSGSTGMPGMPGMPGAPGAPPVPGI